jgi:DNA mismatch endonuclease (patch repair protein)
MTDNISKTQRSLNMRNVRSRDTSIEIEVRRTIHAAGLRFRLHDKKLPGNPDIVLPRHRSVIFVNGCFWHNHEGCRRAKLPSTNSQLWANKIARNVSHDIQCINALHEMGWNTKIVWGCQVKQDTQRVIDELMNDEAATV